MEIPGGLAVVAVLWLVELGRRRRKRRRQALYQRIVDDLAALLRQRRSRIHIT